MYTEFRSKLAALTDETYREFSKKIIVCERPLIGVKIPQIRKLVAEIPAADLEKFIEFEPVAIEEVLARGLAIARLPYEKMVAAFDSQVKLLDNWCTVDTFIAALRKTVKKHEADFYETKVEKLLESSREYETRTGIVALLDYYVKPEYLQVVFDRVEALGNRQEYYVKMALAWLVAECLIKFPEETLGFMRATELDKWTYNKAISKACDSYRVSVEMKNVLKGMRKK
jgi:3-methyladenine DNA glycosylase AlkD